MPPNALTLKQRLAALSANINSPSRSSSFDTPPDSPITSKRKMFFKQPFGKSPTHDAIPGEYHGQERIQEVMNRLIFQAGVDYEYVPCVSVRAPTPVTYDHQDATYVRLCLNRRSKRWFTYALGL